MTLEQRGAYHEMLCVSWQMGPLPEDPSLLARLLGIDIETFQRVWVEPLCGCWQKTEFGLVNERLEDERKWAESRQEKASRAGKASWNARSSQVRTPVERPFNSSSNSEPTIQIQNQIQNQKKKESREPGAHAPSNGWNPPPRAPQELSWFLVSGGMSWEPSFEKELEERFPALAKSLAARGMAFGGFLQELSAWHESAPKSKRKKISAHRWILKLCNKRNKEALHAETWREKTGTPLRQKQAAKKEPKMYETLRRMKGEQIGDG
jgi:uncharacterized protein YdaU (DUF1376 family)